MFQLLVRPHVDFSEGIGAAALSATAAAKKAATAAAAAKSSSAATTADSSSSSSSSSDGVALPASATTSAVPSTVYSLDIGSRLGNMLYSGLLHSDCPRWVGVELDAFFVAESSRIVRKWGMGSGGSGSGGGAATATVTETPAAAASPAHIRVLEADVSSPTGLSLLRSSKLVCFFNSFELHVSRVRHRELLRMLADSICSRGQYILACPSLNDIFTRADSDVDVDEWVTLVAQKDDAFLFRVK
jgi:hypothetical protein